MKKIIFLYLLTTFYFMQAQELKLSFHVPEVRVNSSIDLTYKTINNSQLNKIDGKLTLNSYTKDTGYVTIGPIAVCINGITYHSDSTKIRVIEKLPEVYSGLWMRIVHFDDVDYLIIEQRIESDDKQHEFVSIKEDMKNNSLSISFNSSNQTSQDIQDINGFSKTIKFKVSTYIITKDTNYKGSHELKKQYFLNIPDNYNFPKLEMN